MSTVRDFECIYRATVQLFDWAKPESAWILVWVTPKVSFRLIRAYHSHWMISDFSQSVQNGTDFKLVLFIECDAIIVAYFVRKAGQFVGLETCSKSEIKWW